jgi:hypothetical protein
LFARKGSGCERGTGQPRAAKPEEVRNGDGLMRSEEEGKSSHQKARSHREQATRNKERSGTMDRRKFTATLAALAAGIGLSVGSASAQNPPFTGTAGYLQGDPAPGKLVPYYLADGNVATIIGIENTIGNDGPDGAELDLPIGPTTVHISGGDVRVHFHFYDTRSVEYLNFTKCYSPFDFGYIVLQKGSVTAAQNADLDFPTGPSTTRRNKSEVVVTTVAEGYVAIRAERIFGTRNGTCSEEVQFGVSVDIPDAYDLIPFEVGPLTLPLATWAIVQDIGTAFFATEIPTATARVSIGSPAVVSGGIGAFGLIPQGNEVIARYDAASFNQSVSRVYTWFTSNGSSSGSPRFPAVSGFLDCEDELEISTFIPLPNEAGFFTLSGSSLTPTHPTVANALAVCTNVGQFRGVVRFTMPDTGFIWSHITQENGHFRMNFLGYNLQNNVFIDCADTFQDFPIPAGTPPLCEID